MKTHRTLFPCLTGLLLAAITGCASKPNRAKAAVYSEISATAAPAQPSATPAAPSETRPSPAKMTASPATVQAARETIDPQLLRPSSEPFTLGPGDALELEILGTPASRTTTTVGLDGKIYFNLLPAL